MSAWNITCTTRHPQQCTCKILFVWHQSFIVKSSGQTSEFASRTEKGLVFWWLPLGHFKGKHVLVWVCRSCIDGLVQNCSISSPLALEIGLLQSCTKTSVYIFQCQWWYMHFSSGPSGKTLSYLYNAGFNWYRLLSSGVCNIENFLFRRNSYDFTGATSWWWCSESCCLRHMATAQWAWWST